MSITKVIFRKFKDGEVIAIFPELMGGWSYDSCLSYLHVGQHGGCDIEIISTTTIANKNEYNDLLVELKKIGYDDLKVFTRISKQMHESRLRKYREYQL